MARLAIARSFLADYARLDEDVRSAVDAAVVKLARHPDPGRYVEKPTRSWDDRIRTFEVDGRWRGIALAPAIGDTYCLITVLPQDTARSAELVREARSALEAGGIMTSPLSGRGGGQAVRAGTMHAMKGLEFQAVAVIGVSRSLVPETSAVTAVDEDPVAHAQDVQRERCTLFVACTRARDHLYVSGAGEPSPFLPAAPAPGKARPVATSLQADDEAVACLLEGWRGGRGCPGPEPGETTHG